MLRCFVSAHELAMTLEYLPTSYALFCKWLILYFSISVLKLKYQLKVLKVSYCALFGYGNEILHTDK